MNTKIRLFIISFIFSISLLITQPVFAQVNYNGGTYTNLCGTGTAATAHTCNAGCNIGSGTCTSLDNKVAVVRFQCDGRSTECRNNESPFATSHSLGNPGCGKTVQIDVFDKTCRQSNGNWDSSCQLKDYIVWYSGDCPVQPPPSPAPSPTPAPTPTPQVTPSPIPSPTPAQKSSCDDLSVVGGDNALVPANVTLRARGSDNLGNIQRYKFYFGDGKIEETDSPEITHKYEVSGTFTARADVKDSKGNWKTSSACEATVRVKSAPVESHKADCSDITWTLDNSQAPTTARISVYGYDNKGSIQQYRVDFGNGITKDSDGQTFEQRYETAGTYTVKGYIKDSQGNWQGGDDNCSRALYVNTKPIVRQPSTGTPTLFTIAGSLSGVAGVVTYAVSKRRALLKI